MPALSKRKPPGRPARYGAMRAAAGLPRFRCCCSRCWPVCSSWWAWSTPGASSSSGCRRRHHLSGGGPQRTADRYRASARGWSARRRDRASVLGKRASLLLGRRRAQRRPGRAPSSRACRGACSGSSPTRRAVRALRRIDLKRRDEQRRARARRGAAPDRARRRLTTGAPLAQATVLVTSRDPLPLRRAHRRGRSRHDRALASVTLDGESIGARLRVDRAELGS